MHATSYAFASESISRGYAEVSLPELLTSSIGGSSGELLRCIPLDPKPHSTSTSGLLSGPQWEHAATPASSSTSLVIRKPTVTAEVCFLSFINCLIYSI